MSKPGGLRLVFDDLKRIRMIKLNQWRGIWIVFALLLVCSCGKIQNEYSDFRPYFVYNNNVRQCARLAEAMTPNSGIFCIIQQQFISGATYYVFTNSEGLSQKIIQNDRERQGHYVLGYNNGLIVGYGNLSDPQVFYAYDLECSNCFDASSLPVRSKPLHLASGGIAICNVCHRHYNLNNNGVIISGERGKKLTRYRASSTGPYGILSVN